jgi:CRP-like cAMP-binding protein
VLCEPGRPQHFAYFPTTAIVSLQYMTEDGTSTGIAVVGREGMIGTAQILGGGGTTWQATVLIEGQAFRIGAQTIRAEFERSAGMRQLMLRYIQALAVQIAQTAVCYRHHAIEQQLCGWLLHGLDRLRGAEVVATQELIAAMLGVRRESVTKAAHQLQDMGLIHYSRGHIAVLDRAGLERHSCECHAVVKKEYDRLLPHETRAAPARQEAALAAL